MPRIKLNGTLYDVPAETSVAAALMNAGLVARQSIQGEARGPLCGMGICFECRVTVDGIAHERGCQLMVREGMEVSTDAP
jgi:sarcosine oxidase subunit alpha